MFASLAMAITVMVATLILLAIGMAVGYRLGLRQTAMSAPALVIAPPCEPTRPTAITVDGADLMRSCALVACETVARHRSAAPADLLQAIDQLVAATQRVLEQLSQNQVIDVSRIDVQPEAKPEPKRLAAPPDLEPIYAPSALSASEMQELASSADGFSEDHSPRRRYSYHSYQRVFPIEIIGCPPSLRLARTVRCHDLSVHGISFFWPDEPAFDQLVISLGTNDNPIWMLAEVMQSKAVFMHDEIRTLVGCRFIGRYSWAAHQLENRSVFTSEQMEVAIS